MPLSAANIPMSLCLFAAYGACLWLAKLSRLTGYRIAMTCAVIVFGGGGVVGNLARFIDSGLTEYANLSAFVLAVTINAYGTLLNVRATLGLFIPPSKK